MSRYCEGTKAINAIQKTACAAGCVVCQVDAPPTFDHLFAVNRVKILRYFLRYLPTHEAEDLTQDVFVMAFQKMTYLSAQATETYLYRCAKNRLTDYFRQSSCRQPALGLSLIEDSSQDACFETWEPGYRKTETTHWLAQLTHVMQRVCTKSQLDVLLAYCCLDSWSEIGQELNLPSATVRSHFLRGRAAIVAALIEEESELIGGCQVINQAVRRMKNGSDNSLTPCESAALEHPNPSSKTYRSACLKIAALIPIDF